MNRRQALALWLPAYLCLVVFALPLLTGGETLFLRDVFNTHLPMKVSQAEAFRAGYVPLIDNYRAGGQPALGNPNNVVLYPTNLLLGVVSPMHATNLHFALHLLLAPLAMYWLCRRLGLGLAASIAGGLLYVTTGFYFSQLNFLNLVAGATLSPALVAASLAATDARATKRARSTGLIALALIWALLLLAGDPMSAFQALFLCGLAYVLCRPLLPLAVSARSLVAPICTGFVGTLLAAPQLLEFQAVLASSFRGHWGFSATWALMASLDPRTFIEWLIPMAFGRPDLAFWGHAFFDGREGLFYSLYPGVLSLVLIVATVYVTVPLAWPRRWRFTRAARSVVPCTEQNGAEQQAACQVRVASRFGWLAVLVGTFLALGRFNPLVSAWVEHVGGGGLRFPIKFWLLAAIGLAVLSAVVWQHAFRGRALRVLMPAFLVLIGVYTALWIWASFFGSGIEAFVVENMREGLPAGLAVGERARVAGLSLYNIGLLMLFMGATVLSRRRAVLAGALLLALHATTQLGLLAPAVPTEPTAVYTSDPAPILESIGARELVVHANAGLYLFGQSPLPTFADSSAYWVQRRAKLELYPSYGVLNGVRYELNKSPEALDSFLTVSTTSAFQVLDDMARVRLLKALGVDVLVIDRRLPPEAERIARLRARHDSLSSNVWVYSFPGAAREIELVGSVRTAPNMNVGLAELTSPTFDPRRAVVIPGDGPGREGEPGEARVVARGPESVVVETSSPTPTVLVWRRSWQPLYRAFVDDEPAQVLVGNQSRIAVEVPAGEHRIVIETERGRLRSGLLMSALGLLLLPFLRRLAG